MGTTLVACENFMLQWCISRTTLALPARIIVVGVQRSPCLWLPLREGDWFMARLTPQSSTTPTVRQRPIPALMALAGWHWRRQWLLFLLMNFGMISLIFLVSLLPSL